MTRWLNRQRQLLDFALSSLARRKAKNLGLLLVYTVVVFVLASVMLFSSSPLASAPEACAAIFDQAMRRIA